VRCGLNHKLLCCWIYLPLCPNHKLPLFGFEWVMDRGGWQTDKIQIFGHFERNGLALMGHQEPEPLCSIPHQTQWRIFKGLEAADVVLSPQMPWLLVNRFAGECKTFNFQPAFTQKMAWYPGSIRSKHHSAASLIRPIWRIFKGLKAADLLSWL
jgi:hypothetical protein